MKQLVNTLEMSTKRLNALRGMIGQPVNIDGAALNLPLEDFIENIEKPKQTIVIETVGFNHTEQQAFIEYFILENTSEDMQEVIVPAEVLHGWLEMAYPELVAKYSRLDRELSEQCPSWYDIIEYGMTKESKEQFALFCARANEVKKSHMSTIEKLSALRKKYRESRIGLDIPDQKIIWEQLKGGCKELGFEDSILIVEEEAFQLFTKCNGGLDQFKL